MRALLVMTNTGIPVKASSPSPGALFKELSFHVKYSIQPNSLRNECSHNDPVTIKGMTYCGQSGRVISRAGLNESCSHTGERIRAPTGNGHDEYCGCCSKNLGHKSPAAAGACGHPSTLSSYHKTQRGTKMRVICKNCGLHLQSHEVR